MRGQSICVLNEVAEKAGLQVTIEEKLSGEVNLSAAGTLFVSLSTEDKETLSTLVEEAVVNQLDGSTSPSPPPPRLSMNYTTNYTTNYNNSNSSNDSNDSNKTDASTVGGDTRRLQSTTREVNSSGQCSYQSNPSVPVSFSVPTLGDSAEFINSTQILLDLQSSLELEYPEQPICVNWVQPPIVIQEVVIRTKTGEEIKTAEAAEAAAEAYDYLVPPDAGDAKDEDGNAASGLAIAITIIVIVIICSAGAITLILNRKRGKKDKAREVDESLNEMPMSPARKVISPDFEVRFEDSPEEEQEVCSPVAKMSEASPLSERNSWGEELPETYDFMLSTSLMRYNLPADENLDPGTGSCDFTSFPTGVLAACRPCVPASSVLVEAGDGTGFISEVGQSSTQAICSANPTTRTTNQESGGEAPHWF
jgi:hypothetical protein